MQELPRLDEVQWQAVIGNAPVFMMLLDDSDRIQFINRISRTTAVEDVVGKEVYDFIETEFVPQVRQTVARARNERVTGFYECIAYGQDQERIWYETRVSPVVVDDEVIAVLLIALDISARKKIESEVREERDQLERRVEERTAELREANERLRREVAERREAEKQLRVFETFAEASAQAFGIADAEGIIQYANSALATLYREPGPEQVVGKHVTEYFSQEYLERRENEVLPTVENQGYWQGEVTLQSRTGEPLPVMLTAFTLRDSEGNLTWRGAVMTDLREIKQTEQILRESLSELQTIYEGMEDGLLVADIPSKRLVKANRAICEMLGYTREELTSMSVMDLHPQSNLPAILRIFQKAVESNTTQVADLPMLRKDGSLFTAEITTNRIIYGGCPCLLGLLRDVSQRREAEAALRRMLLASDREREVITQQVHDNIAQPLAAALRNTALGEGRRGEFHEQVGLRCPVIRIGIVRQRYISRKV